MIVCLALSPALDVTHLVPSLRVGGIARPTRTVKVAGGKGLNVARSVARLGAPVRAVAVLGGRTGALIADLLDGVDLRAVPIEGESRTCVSIAADDADGLTEVYEPAPALDAVAWDAVQDAVAGLGAGDRIVVSGSLPAGVEPSALAELLTRARSAGVQAVIDTHGSALEAAVGAAPAVVKVNRSEASALLGGPDASAEHLARGVHDRTGGVAIVTDGLAGSSAVDGEGVVHVPADTARGRFPVGSGDSYTAGVVVGLDRGEPLPAAVRLGAACATANALVPGAGEWDLDAMRAVLRRLTAST